MRGSETANGYFAAGVQTAKSSQEQASTEIKRNRLPKGHGHRGVEPVAGSWAERQPGECILCYPWTALKSDGVWAFPNVKLSLVCF